MPLDLVPTTTYERISDAPACGQFVTADGVTDYDRVFITHRVHLLRTARRYLRNREDAEDTVHDAFLRWRGVDKTGIHDAKAWLTTTVAHLAIDHLRRANRERLVNIQATSEHLENADRIADDGGEPREWHFALFTAHALMEQLSVAERIAFTLHDVFEYSYDDIAKVVGKKVPACRQLAHRARIHISAWQPRFDPRNCNLLVRLLAAALINADINLVVTLLTQGLGSIS